MALETASYVANLVESNPDGLDQRSTADNHLRLIKAALKRTFPKMDGAVSLSSAQVMYLNDVSASVQLQLNQLRDGSATANNALYANSASYASFAATANSASYAAFAGQAASASFATLAATANSASYAAVAGAASSANSASFATYASHAQSASFATAASTATTATTATTASNASAVNGYAANEGAVGSTVVARTSQGYVYGTYFNQSSANEGGAVTSVMVCISDNFLRKMSPSTLGAQLEGRNISGRSGTAKNLAAGSGPPSLVGSTNGDLFYYYTP